MSSQPIPRLTSRQSWCISLDSVMYPIGRGNDGIPENMYKSELKQVLYQERSIELASKVPSGIENMVYFTLVIKRGVDI